MQSFLLCVLSVALGVASVLIASYSVAYAVLSVALTIVHFDGTSILFLHNIRNLRLPALLSKTELPGVNLLLHILTRRAVGILRRESSYC